MRVGVTLTDSRSAVAEARLAEKLGFDYVSVGEHVFFHGPMPNAFVTLAAAAGATERIRLVSSVALLPLYPPALAAKLVATLDQVSQGRFELGVGTGGEYPQEFEACGVDVASRSRRLDEALEVMRLLFKGGPVTYDGEFTQLSGVALEPLPVQRPGPSVWVGGRRAGARRRAARFGDVWLPYMVTPQMLREGLEQIHELTCDEERDGPVAGALFAWCCVGQDGSRARATAIENVSAIYRQDFTPLADRYLITGTPADVTSRLEEFRDAGAEHVLLAVAAPAADREQVIRLLAEHVIPALQAARS